MQDMNIINYIVFDFEVNGLDANSSVTEVAALRYSFNFVTKENVLTDVLHHFYLPVEVINISSSAVTGLTEESIREYRKNDNADYPEFFKDDLSYIESFFDSVDYLIAHNVSFDKQYLPESIQRSKGFYCTMEANKDIVKAQTENGRLKMPTLEETAAFYGVPFDATSAHGALYDTSRLFEIVKVMISNGTIPFLSETVVKNNEFLIRDKFQVNQAIIKNPFLLLVDKFEFIISTKAHLNSLKGLIFVYEKKSGNLFLTVDKESYEAVHGPINKSSSIMGLNDIIKAKIDKIGVDSLDTIINQYLNKAHITVQKNLFDF